MSLAEQLDALTVEQLREQGGLKWTRYPDQIGSFVAEMDFGTAPPVAAALHAAVDRAAFGYLPEPAADDLARACARWTHDSYGWDVPPAWIRPLPDVIAGLQVAMDHFSEPGSAVIVPTPAYMPFLLVPELAGRRQIEVPMALETTADGPRYHYDLDALDAAFNDGGGLLILCNPHNPVGRVLERAEMLAVAEVVERHGGRVFSDEIHAPLVFDPHRHLPYASLDEVTAAHTVTATSASKAWNLPGLKCAQLIMSNETDVATWSAAGFFSEHGASTLGVLANIAAYDEGGPWLAEVLDYLEVNRRLLAGLVHDRLPGVEVVVPEGTYLALLDCRGAGLESPAAFFAEHAGVALTEGTQCGRAGTGLARMNFATPRPVLQETVDRLAGALHAR